MHSFVGRLVLGRIDEHQARGGNGGQLSEWSQG